MGQTATRSMAALGRLTLVLLIGVSLTRSQPVRNSYVGSKACFGCHSGIYKSFVNTAMGHSITPAAEWKPDGVASTASLRQEGTDRILSVSLDEKGWKQTESAPGMYSAEHQLAYAVGSGMSGVTFLIRRGNFLFQAPLSYYSKAGKWDFSPGYEHLDLGFSRKAPQECLNCHAGRAAVSNASSGEYANPPFEELSIGCENCHGPGEQHVKSPGKVRGAIVNPAKLPARLAEDICLNCHQAGDARVLQPGRAYQDFRPGQPLFDTALIAKQPARTQEQAQADLLEHHSAMRASRCFRASGGKLSCLSCHDPHLQPTAAEAPAYFRAKCLTCHTEANCRVPVKTRLQQSPPDDCAGCHMPKRPTAQVSHSALTNHRIPASKDEPPPPPQEVEVEGIAIVDPPFGRPVSIDKLTLLGIYRSLGSKDRDYLHRYDSLLDELAKSRSEDKSVQAALGERALLGDRAQEAIEHLQLAMPSSDPNLLLALGQAWAKLNRPEDAIKYFAQGAALDPYNAVMQKSLILQYINAKSYAGARQAMEQYVLEFPEDTFMRSLLSRVSQ